MSEKVTFGELIESIAEETDNSKQFTHDFLKDFVDVINNGLEQDGTVNIAGFGKFNLRRVEEREGYNPQTEENMTIPTHNKIVFKPYKDLRELVNAPYAHLEPELIKKKDEDDSTEEGSKDPKDNDQTDFIPTGPPTQESKEDTTEEAPFDLDDHEDEDSSDFSLEDDAQESEEDDSKGGDIVEFEAEKDVDREEDELDDELDEFFETPDEKENEKKYQPGFEAEQSAEDEEDQQEITNEEETTVEETRDKAEELMHESKDLLDSLEEDEDEKKKEEEQTAQPTLKQHRSTRKRTSSTSLSIIATAALILIVMAGGAWYFGVFSNNGASQIASQETASTPDVVNTNTDQQEQAQTSNQSQQQGTQKTQNQSQQLAAGSSSQASTTNNDSDMEGIELQKGQTLWNIAEDKYGNPRLWPWIYGTNEALENPNLIYAGNSLSVPLPSGPQNSLNTADSVGVAKGFIATYRWYKDNRSSKAKDHLWAAKLYHDDIRNIADVQIDKADLTYANSAR